jgi:hypothetical protein
LLLRVIAAVDTIGLTGKQENSVANKLRMSIRMIFRHAIVADQRDLLAKVPGFPRAHARIVVAAAAAENFDVLRPQLAALLTGGLPEGAAQQVHDDMRVRSRSSATMALPLLLLPLAGNGDN